MAENCRIADTISTYVQEDNCVYVSVPSDKHSVSQEINSNKLFDSKNVLQDCIIVDQIDNNHAGFNSQMIYSNVRISIENESRSSLQEITNQCTGLQGLLEADKSTQASIVIHMDDLKNELEGSNTENIQEIQSTSQDFNIINTEKQVKSELSTQADLSEFDGDVCIELPKDPKELLDTLTPMLETDGGLKKNMQDSFLKIMGACDPLPLQCLLINIIRSSQHSVLKRLLLKGGFDELHAWLKDARSQINTPLMLELLQLFKLLPVTTKLLRTNSCAKDIKQLIKNNDERISRFARVIVDDWMKIVSGSSAKPKEKLKGVDHKVDKITAKHSPSTPPKPAKPNSIEKVHKSEIANDSPKKQAPISNNEEKVVQVERPKTVKRKQFTFRMTGLEEDATFKSIRRSTATTTTSTTSTTTASAISGGPPSPKKNENDATKYNFFDALQFNSSFLQHRKRKFSVATTTKTLTSTTSTTTATATTPTTVATNTTVVSTPSPVISQNDLSNVLPGFSYYKPLEDSEPSKTEPSKTEPSKTEPTKTVATKKTTTTKITTSVLKPIITSSHTNNIDAPAAKKRKSKKSVTWASVKHLCNFRFFEVDSTERCNVNTNNYFHHDDNETFVDHCKQESKLGRELLQEWHNTKQPATASQPTDSIEWRTPALIDFEAPNDVVPGSESAEKGIQMEREAAVLRFIHFDPATTPEFPAEPDSPSEVTPPECIPCKIIPLLPEEETDENKETDQPEESNQPTNKIPDSSIAPITSQNAPFSVSSNMTEHDLSNAINTGTPDLTNPSSHSIDNSLPDDSSSNMLNDNNINNNSDPYSYTNHSTSNYDYDHKNNYNHFYENTIYDNHTNNSAYFPPYNNNAPYDRNDGYFTGADSSYGDNTNHYYNDQGNNNPAFPNKPFQQTTSTHIYPIGFNQPIFDSSNQRPPFDGERGQHRDYTYPHNGDFGPNKFNRSKSSFPLVL